MSHHNYYLVHTIPNKIEIETEDFYGPFDSKESAEQYCDKRYLCCGRWRDEPKLVKIVVMNTCPFPLVYEGFHSDPTNKVNLANGFMYGGIYYGPFKNQYSLMKAVIESGDAENMANKMTMFEMWAGKQT